MPPVVPSRKHRALQAMAQAQNGVDALTSQQQSGVSAPTPGAALIAQTSQPVYQSGVIPTTPANTPGAHSARYGMCFYDQHGVLQVQIDQFGWHLFTNTNGVAVYSSELVTYT